MTTIKDVARRAGVSPATVSRVLTGRKSVASALAERVQGAVHELNYRPSAVARSLRTQRTKVWGMIISDIRNPFFTDLVRGVEDGARRYGYSLILGNADERLDKEAAYIELFVAERMAGVIISPASQKMTDVRLLREHGMPVVAVDRELSDDGVDAVLVDNEGGAYAATAHLIEQGFERIACVTGPDDRTTATARLDGYLRAHAAVGRVVEPGMVRHSDFKQTGGYASAVDLLSARTRPDAFFIANNLMTLGALEAFAERGCEVPGDVGVVGFDDMPWAALLRPPLTTIAQPAYAMGETTAELLYQRGSGDKSPPRRVILAAELRIRASSIRATG
jgi:LacI family transcriptional regulator